MWALLAQVSAAEHVASPPAFQVDPTVGDRLQRGATQLQVLKEEAARKGEAGAPQASCWAAAVGKLESGCAQVAKDDDVQSRLAVEFTNCHLAKSGLPTYECTPAMTLQDCTRPMVDSASGLAYSTYTLFYTHTESICFYMQSQAFQASTEAAVNSLHAAGIEAASRLQGLQQQAAEIGGRAAEILSEQAAAAAAQQALLQGQRQAREELSGLQQAQAASFAAAESALGALGAQSRSALEELKKDTAELSLKGKSLLGGVDRLLGLQEALLGEFMDTKTFLFYTCSVFLSLALTSTQRTASARLPIFLTLTLNVLVEKAIIALLLRGGAQDGAAAAAAAERVHVWLWASRRLFGTIGLLALLHALAFHTDLGKKTVAMLGEVKQLQKQGTEEMLAQLRDLLEQQKRREEGRRAREMNREIVHSALSRHRRASKSPSPARVHAKAAAREGPAARPNKSPVRGGAKPTEAAAAAAAAAPPPLLEHASTAETVVLGDKTVSGGGLSLERPESRASDQVSDEASCELTRANLASLDQLTGTTSGPTGRGSITPARKAPNRRHSQSTEDLTPSRRSERIAKQKCGSTGGP